MAKTPTRSYRASPKAQQSTKVKVWPGGHRYLATMHQIADAIGIRLTNSEILEGKATYRMTHEIKAMVERAYPSAKPTGVVGARATTTRLTAVNDGIERTIALGNLPDDQLKNISDIVMGHARKSEDGLDHQRDAAGYVNIHERYRENASKAIRNIATALGLVPKWDPPTLPMDVPGYEKMILEEIARLRKAWIDIAAKSKPAQDGQKSPSPVSFDWYDIRVGKYKMRVQVSRVDGDCVRYPQKSLAKAVADVTEIAVRNNQPASLMARQALSINGVTSVYIQTAKNQHAYEIRKD